MIGNKGDRLNDFLYEVIFVPKGIEKPDKDIIKRPEHFNISFVEVEGVMKGFDK
ncbi:hypothetical protein ACVR1G_03210 [Streptococcus dentasini]